MKILCVGDAYVTSQMMLEGVKPCLTEDDTIEVLFFGEENRTDMRDTVKAIESMKREEITVPQDLYDAISDCEVLIVHLCPVTRKLLGQAKKLKAILSCRGGVENIDVAAANEKNIIITTNPAHNANAVAEYTIGLLICETRNIQNENHNQNKPARRSK